MCETIQITQSIPVFGGFAYPQGDRILVCMHTYTAQQRTTATLAHRWTVAIGTHQRVGYSEVTLIDIHGIAHLAQLITLEPEQKV